MGSGMSRGRPRSWPRTSHTIGQWQYGNYRDQLMEEVHQCIAWCEAEQPCWHWNFHSIDAMCVLRFEGAWFEPGEEQLNTHVWFAGNSSRAGARRLGGDAGML